MIEPDEGDEVCRLAADGALAQARVEWAIGCRTSVDDLADLADIEET
jgi:hypothetical protein